MDDLNISGKVSVVTGGASGIGKQIALTFAEHGSDIAILDINVRDGKSLESEIKKNYKRNCIFINCDISDSKIVEKSREKIIKNFKKVDNVICAAGYEHVMPANEITIDVWKKTLSINLSGNFFVIRSFINLMLSQKKGNIIIIGSSAYINGGGAGVDYAASKAGLYGLMKALTYELLSKGIRTNIITPAVIDTPILRKRYPNKPDINRLLTGQIPLGRIGNVKDVANIALFLASDMSDYICGAEIIADGGRTLYKRPKAT